MNEILWYLTRATGIVATVLAVAALSWGFLFSARDRQPAATELVARSPQLAGRLHVGLHRRPRVVLVPAERLLDRGPAGLRPEHVLLRRRVARVGRGRDVPVRHRRVHLVAQATLPRDVWRWIHLGSVFGTGLALLHGYRMGTDAGGLIAKAALVILVGVGMYPLGLRLFGDLEAFGSLGLSR
ncbi:MAG: hypothetical protein R2705_06750 [Ilumatobacteraceae bacterium]